MPAGSDDAYGMEKFKHDTGHKKSAVSYTHLDVYKRQQVVPMKKKRFTPKAAAAIAAVVLAAGSGSAAYAMDVGGIQRIVQVWIHGDQTLSLIHI